MLRDFTPRFVGPSIGPSVGPSQFTFFGFCGLWPHSSCPDHQVTSNKAPAHPHATGVAVYPVLFHLDRYYLFSYSGDIDSGEFLHDIWQFVDDVEHFRCEPRCPDISLTGSDDGDFVAAGQRRRDFSRDLRQHIQDHVDLSCVL